MKAMRTKPYAWYVDVAALVDHRPAWPPAAAFGAAPRAIAAPLLSALACSGDQIAYYSTDYHETDFQVIDDWLAEHHFPDGVMYLASMHDDRPEHEIRAEIHARLAERFELRGYVIDSEDVLDGITITDCVE